MVKHLPPSVKHLLTLRNPNVLPGPPPSQLQTLFTRTSRDAKLKNAETGWLVLTSYGMVLSPLPGETKAFHDESGLEDPNQGNLSRALGSVVGIAALRAEGRVGPQLVSHTFGLLKARYVEDLSAEDAWLSSDEGTEWVLRTVDEILDVVSSEDQGNEVKVKL
ncbi:hypothetical protein H0H87_001181 [Tephrocybe sp. NHM501043]|nr:hypothetical protein H0H87_001181 [Tephrocybe sp. NHM501043]